MLPPWLTQVAMLLVLAAAALGYKIVAKRQIQRLKLDQHNLTTPVTPQSYYLKLFPHISEGYYNGSVEINVTCQESAHAIVMHANENLIINHEQVTVSNMWNSVDLSIISISRNVSSELMTITLDEEMQGGDQYHIHIQFSGIMKDISMDYGPFSHKDYGGFFRGSYENMDNKRSWYAATLTFPAFARRVFPCFDEPSFKATFEISVARLNNMSTLSVMPLDSTEIAEEEGYVWDHFPPTPPISTFSVNVLVSDLESSDPVNVAYTQSNFLVQFHSRQNHKMTLQDGTKLVPRLLEYLEDYFGVLYPLPKLDIVALPCNRYDMKMNSLGLIVLQEIMVDNRVHEFQTMLVNQWLNHMITPHKWSDFGVTDTLGSYLSKDAEKKLTDKMDLYDQPYLTYELFATHFNYTDRERWDPNPMKRGEWFLQMLNSTLTENTIRTALGMLISNNMYSTITEDMLWAAFTQQAHMDRTLPDSLSVENIAESWIHSKLMHYPVVTVTRNYDDNSASLEQHVFMTELPHNLTEEEEALLWSIPIRYLTPDNMDPTSVRPIAWMEGRHLDIINLPDSQSFIIMNPTDEGMFLVNYDKHNWKLLSQHLIAYGSQLPKETRTKLLQDALILAAGGELDYALALDMTLFLFNENEISVWAFMINHVENIEKFYRSTSVEYKFNAYLKHLLARFLASLNAPDYDDGSGYGNLWYTAKYFLNKFGQQSRINEARKQLETMMPTFSIHDNDTQLVLFCPEFMRNSSGKRSTYNEELETFMESNYDMHYFMGQSLAKCPGYTDYIQGILNELLDEDMLFTSDKWYRMINLITSSETAQNMTFSYLLEHFKELKQKFYFMQDMWLNFVSSITLTVNTQERLNELTQFYDQYKNKLGYCQSAVETAINQATMIVDWHKRNLADIEYWLDHVLPNFM